MSVRSQVVAFTTITPGVIVSGGPVRIAALIEGLARRFDLVVVGIAEDADQVMQAHAFAERSGFRVRMFIIPDRSSWGHRALVWGRAIFEGSPPYIVARYGREAEAAFAEEARSSAAVVLLDDYAGIFMGRRVFPVPVIADKHNVLTATAQRLPRQGPVVSRLRQTLFTGLLRRYEQRYLQGVSATIVTSDLEAERLQETLGMRAQLVLPSGVDLPAQVWRPPAGEGRELVWLGNLDYTPNVDGLRYFVKHAWRPLGEQGFVLNVVGGGDVGNVSDLGGVPGVVVHGFVADLDSYLCAGRLGIVPLWAGAGVKLKTLTLLAAGVPTVATTVAMEGLENCSNVALVSDSCAGLVEGLQQLAGDMGRAASMGLRGREVVAREFSAHSLAEEFARHVEGVIAGELTVASGN